MKKLLLGIVLISSVTMARTKQSAVESFLKPVEIRVEFAGCVAHFETYSNCETL